MVHPQAGEVLQQVQHLLALAEAERHRGGGAELHAAGGDVDQVRADPVDLQQHHAQQLRAARGLDLQQLLDAEAVRHLRRKRGQVVHARHERDALGPGPVLAVLLDAGVQVADDRPQLRDGLALHLQHEPEHAVRRRVLRAHVDDHALVVRRVGDDVVPVAAGDRVDAAFGGVTGIGVVDVVGAVAARRLGRPVVTSEVPVLDRLRKGVVGAHEYDLRWSGGGISAPLYSTGIPPSG